MGSFSTTFSTIENPLSDGGAWHHTPNQWANIAVVSGPDRAVGTQTGADGFNDSYAYLTGFSPDVIEQATIYKDPTIAGDPNGSHEAELLLRANDTSSSVQAYECNISFDGAYAQIVRWNGPLGNFTYLDGVSVVAAFGRAPQTGDIFSASIVGSTITVWLDGVQLMTTSDSTYATGNPGIGMWLHDGYDPTKFAFTNYSVSDIGSPPPPSPPPPPGNNLVVNGSFETDSFSGWTLSGNVGSTQFGPQVLIGGNAEDGQLAAVLGPIGSDGTLSQNIQTTAGESYTVSFWLANRSGGPNDFTAKWNGQTLLALNNAPQQGYTEYTYQVSSSGSTSNLEFDFRQDPTDWSLDNVSIVDNGAASGGGSPPPPSTIDTTAPAQPEISLFSPDSAPSGDGHTTATTLTLSGAGEANSTIQVFDGTNSLGTAPVNSNGAWNITASNLALGSHSFTATDTDAAGNTSVESAPLSVTIDASSPPPSGAGAGNPFGLSDNVSVVDNGAASGGGSPPPPSTIDTTAPAQPEISLFSPDSAPSGDGHTTATNLTLSGAGEANSTIQVFDGTNSLGTAPVNSNGAWNITASNLALGSHSFTATDTDAAGNTSVESAPLSVTIDASSPPPSGAGTGDLFGLLTQFMAAQVGSNGGGGTVVSSQPTTVNSDPVTLANPFGLGHS